MSYVVVATYVARSGEADAIAAALQRITPLARAEPACREYRAHRSLEDPNLFLIYEEYHDEAGFDAHCATEHFACHIRDECWPRLAQRTVVRAQPLHTPPSAALFADPNRGDG